MHAMTYCTMLWNIWLQMCGVKVPNPNQGEK